MTCIVCDSSLLILISKLEMLELLIGAFNKIIIPQAVFEESVIQGKRLKKLDSFLIEQKVKEEKIFKENIKDFAEKENLIKNFNLHEGESEAIILYLERTADLLGTDDYRSLTVCKILNVKYFTTPLFITRCYFNKKVPYNLALTKLEKLQEFGWYKEELILEFKNKIKKKEV